MRPLPLLAVLALAACSGPVNTGFGGFSGFGGFGSVPPAPSGPRGERDSRADACQAEATRVVQWRDRGQLMRVDEIENRGDGNITVAPPSRAESDRLGAALERDRIAAECYRAAREAQPAVPGGGAARRQESVRHEYSIHAEPPNGGRRKCVTPQACLRHDAKPHGGAARHAGGVPLARRI